MNYRQVKTKKLTALVDAVSCCRHRLPPVCPVLRPRDDIISIPPIQYFNL